MTHDTLDDDGDESDFDDLVDELDAYEFCAACGAGFDEPHDEYCPYAGHDLEEID